MGSWRRVGAFLGLVPDGDPEASDFEYAERGREESSSEPSYRPLRTTRTRSGQFDRDGSSASAPMVHGALAVQMEPEPLRASESSTASRPLTVKLTGFGEARIVGERYREGASVILDMTDLTDNDARRVVDFAAGLAFAKRGSIDKVTARVFMLLPPHVDMSAEDRQAFAGGYARR